MLHAYNESRPNIFSMFFLVYHMVTDQNDGDVCLRVCTHCLHALSARIVLALWSLCPSLEITWTSAILKMLERNWSFWSGELKEHKKTWQLWILSITRGCSISIICCNVSFGTNGPTGASTSMRCLIHDGTLIHWDTVKCVKFVKRVKSWLVKSWVLIFERLQCFNLDVSICNIHKNMMLLHHNFIHLPTCVTKIWCHCITKILCSCITISYICQ